jgi:acetyl-CoA C-acetyltransferase
MSDIVIAGIGQTNVGEHWDISLRELAYNAIQAAMQDAGGMRPQALYVGNMLAPILSRQAHLGALLVDFAGLNGIEAATLEAAGASGAAALRQGYLAIASGFVETALVVGIEKFTDTIGADTESALATTTDSDFEAVQGLTPTAQAALLMRRYQYEFQVPPNGFAGFAVSAHAHGAGNPNAMYQKAIQLETYQKAEMVSEPLNMFDIAPMADGAAAVLLTRSELLPPNFPHPLVRIAGSASATDSLAMHDRQEPMFFQAAHLSTTKALHQAGIRREDIHLFEYFDAFSIYAALSLEAAGYAPRGQGWKMAEEGVLGLKGSLPCGCMGGLKARGHPGGATGVYQAVEATLQLRGGCGENQIPEARYALIQALGGPASTAISHVLERFTPHSPMPVHFQMDTKT